MTMNINKYKLNNDMFKSLCGKFHHLHSAGIVMSVGGAARSLASKLFGSITMEVNDYDWTVIGPAGTEVGYQLLRGRNRIEIENGAPHSTLSSYMSSRDFTINQVAINSNGELFATNMAKYAFKNRIIEFCSERIDAMTPREAVRACRFALEYNFKLSSRVRKAVRAMDVSTLMNESCWERYSRKYDLESFVRSL